VEAKNGIGNTYGLNLYLIAIGEILGRALIFITYVQFTLVLTLQEATMIDDNRNK
jgi:hypothetical protein